MKRYTKEWHRAFGRHSNIPECCIEFFLELNGKGRSTNATLYNMMLTTSQILLKRNYPYNPCPYCWLKNRFQKLHICDKNNEECRRFKKFK